jgi:hypothetical protein
LVDSSAAFQSPRPHRGAVVHDGSVGGGGGLKFYFIFIFSSCCNTPAPTEGLSWTTAPWWRRGCCNATEPRAIVGGGEIEIYFKKKKNKIIFFLIFFFFSLCCNTPAPTEGLSWTTAPRWRRGCCNATEPRAIVEGGEIEITSLSQCRHT